MEHNLKPILLIDDKTEGQNRGEIFIQDLQNELKSLVEFHLDIGQLIKKVNEWSVELLFKPQNYVGIYLHQSYNDSLLNPSKFAELKHKLGDDLVTFSGGNNINLSSRELPRDIFYKYLKATLDAYLKMGVFPVQYLFGGKINRFYPIIDEMTKVLEEEGKDNLLNHKSFELYTSICNWDLQKVKKNFRENYSEEQIADKINEWRLNSKQ